MNNELNDDLNDLIGGAPRVKPVSAPAAAFVPAIERTFTEACKACGGSGRFYSNRSGRDCGPCFKCKGTGRHTFKTAPEARAKARSSSRAKRTEARETFLVDHAAEIAWVRETANRQEAKVGALRDGPYGQKDAGKVWQFPIDMRTALQEWGSWTDGQLAAIRKCMASDADRKAQRATEKTAREASAIAVDATKLEEAFAHARAKAAKGRDNVKWLKVRLGTFEFLDMPAKGQWTAAILVKDNNGEKLGRISGGKLVRGFKCDDATEAKIAEVVADPAKAAVAYGILWKECAVCGLELTKPESRARGIGPICASKFGW